MIKFRSIAGAVALASALGFTLPALASEAGLRSAGDPQASAAPDTTEAPGEWASAEATVKTTAPGNCRHSPMHREADGCTPGSCNSAKQAVRAAMRQAIGAACDQYIVVKSTCQYGPGCKK